MAKPQLADDILAFVHAQSLLGVGGCSPQHIAEPLHAGRATVNRYLAQLVERGLLVRQGQGPATRYALPSSPLGVREPLPSYRAGKGTTTLVTATATAAAAGTTPATTSGFQFSARQAAVLRALQAPLGSRDPVGYQRALLESYQPNQTPCLPVDLAEELFAEGRSQGQLPAGTFARKVLEQLLIDLSWHSSRLEGNRMSQLDTQALFQRGRSEGDDPEAIMLLNHKEAIEFIVDAVPEYGIREDVVRNIQALLMQGLLADPDAVGAIRNTVVNIIDSVYVPLQVPQLLQELLALLIEKARQIKNPVEAAFFLWVHMAYLQPFEDGNKRTSRLCANLPLLLQNCAPLSFLDVQRQDYTMAVLALYERQDWEPAIELFAWTYRRSIRKYGVVRQSLGAPDPLRARFREQLGHAIRAVVQQGHSPEAACAALGLPEGEAAEFAQLLRQELAHLQTWNCARYRLSIRATADWLAAQRTEMAQSGC